MNKTIKILLFSIISSLMSNVRAHEIPQALATYQEKFKDTLLVINFNYPHYNSIPFLKELYGIVFPQVVFYGESAHPDVTVMPINKGILLATVIEDVIVKYPHYNGYFILQDDCVLNIWNCLTLDLNKLWLPRATLDATQLDYIWYQSADMLNGPCPNTRWWQSEWGYAPLQKAWSSLTPIDRDLLARNVLENHAPGAQCDLFYIPRSYCEEVLRLNEILKDVFCEIAIPTIFSALATIDNWEKATLYWNYSPNAAWPMDATCIHPVKFSIQANKTYVKEIFDAMIT